MRKGNGELLDAVPIVNSVAAGRVAKLLFHC
jgi:hypothetical protein